MAEPTYRWVNVYDNSVALHNTRGAADVLGYSRRRCDRYRVENGILVYDPEPVSRHVDSLRWIAVDSGNNFRVLTGFVDGEKPAHCDDEFAVVCRVRDKAADDKLLERANGSLEPATADSSYRMQLARERDEALASRAAAINQAEDLDNERIRRIAELERERDEAREHHRRLIRERDEAIKARDDWQMSAEWGWGDVGHGTELLKKAEDRIAELERERDEARRQRDDWQSMVVVRNRNLDTQAARIAELERQVAVADQRLAAAQRGCPHERYPEVADFLNAFGDLSWSMEHNHNGDPSKLATAILWQGPLRGLTFARPTIAAACSAALAAKEKADG